MPGADRITVDVETAKRHLAGAGFEVFPEACSEEPPALGHELKGRQGAVGTSAAGEILARGPGQRWLTWSSEQKLENELELSGRVVHIQARDLSVLSVADRSVGVVKVGCIRDVEALSAELDPLRFGDGEILEERKIHMPKVWAVERVWGFTAERSRRLRDEGGDVE
jgi:hypothetical protein